MRDLSVIIPARNEEFLQRTIEEVVTKSKCDTEVIAVLDGYWPKERGIPIHDRVNIVHHEQSIGQRAAVNEGVKLSDARFIMKLDAHCGLDEGFDTKLMEHCEDDWTVVPRMYVLDAFHWVCKQCGMHHDQGPPRDHCDGCGAGGGFRREIVWKIKRRKKSDYMWFDPDMRIQYFNSAGLNSYATEGLNLESLKDEYSHDRRDWAKSDVTDVMCGIGACWFQHRKRFLDLGGLDEGHGSWGQVAVEVACKAWLSGGRHVVNKNTWFAHLPRTQPGFSWPYPMSGRAQQKARAYSRELWLKDNWPGQERSFSWIIGKFSPLPGWDRKHKSRVGSNGEPLEDGRTTPSPTTTNELATPARTEPAKGLVYYTDNQCEERVASVVRQNLSSIVNGWHVVSTSLWPLDFGDNRVIREDRSALTMFKQILDGLERVRADIVFLVEHDVLYHSSHFDFIPPERDIFYYNEHRWQVCVKTGKALHWRCKQTSACCAYRDLLLDHYRKRVDRVEREGKYDRKIGYEPGCHQFPRGIDHYTAEAFWTEIPNVDLRHSNNRTPTRWTKEEFRSKSNLGEWTESDEVPGWGYTRNRFDQFLAEVADGLRSA